MLKRTLTTGEAFIVSLAVIAPTVAMSFNTGLTVKVAGRAAPLAFVIGGVMMAVVAFSFVAFGGRIASAGSAVAFVDLVFGRRAAFMTGWMLLFAYVGFLAAATGLAGGFTAVALVFFGIRVPALWLWVAASAAILAAAAGGVEMRRVSLAMVALDLAAVLAMGGLAGFVPIRVPWSAAPFRPDPGFGCRAVALTLAGWHSHMPVSCAPRCRIDEHRDAEAGEPA